MTHLGGTVRINTTTAVVVGLFPTPGIELAIERHSAPDLYGNRRLIDRQVLPLAFDDAEHLACLLRDLALVVRYRAGVGELVVA